MAPGVLTRGKDIDAEPFEIPLQGMGLFACFKHQWLGFNLRFRGFGGEEGYIHEKFRQHGGRVLCLPFLRWTHRFDRPNGTKYVNAWEDRIRNYLIGWHELELDQESVLQHFAKLRGFDVATSTNAKFLRELNSPLWAYDTLYLLSSTEEQTNQVKSALSIFAIDSIIQEIDDILELPILLTTAITRKLNNVIIIDVRHGIVKDLHLQLQHLVTSEHADVVIQTDSNQTTYQSCLIQRPAFEAAAVCYEQHQTLTENAIHEASNSLSVRHSTSQL